MGQSAGFECAGRGDQKCCGLRKDTARGHKQLVPEPVHRLPPGFRRPPDYLKGTGVDYLQGYQTRNPAVMEGSRQWEARPQTTAFPGLSGHDLPVSHTSTYGLSPDKLELLGRTGLDFNRELSGTETTPRVPGTTITDSHMVDNYLALKALYSAGGSPHFSNCWETVAEQSVRLNHLPDDFFATLAMMVAADPEVNRGMATGEMPWSTSWRSRFLHECIRDRHQQARDIWVHLDMSDKQDLLLAYSERRAPTSDFFIKMMSAHDSHNSPSDCGSSSTDFEVQSDTTYRSNISARGWEVTVGHC